MKQWRGMSRIMAWVAVALAVFSGSPAWAKRRGQHAVPSLVVLTAFWLLPLTPRTIVPAAASGCQLHFAKGDIQHVIFLIFDNVHFLRDNPHVPSDLEQMPNLLNFIRSSGMPKNTPVPWVPYTRAGCDFGAVALANVVLENTGTGPNGDMTKVFGSGSPEWLEAQTSNAATGGTAARQLAQTDFVGIAIHCGQGGSICAGNSQAKPDLLPDEPGSYDGLLGLFGAKYVNPAIAGCSAAVNNLNNQPITDQFGQPGFPGFDGLFASTTLAYIAQMQEHGIPVTFGYISDAHDQHGGAGEIHAPHGPGEADYGQQ